MRYTRFIATIVFTSALIFSLCISSFAAPAVTDKLLCEYGVAHYTPMNSSGDKWVDYEPSANDTNDKFTFSNLPNVLVQGNYEYSFDSFAFMMYPSNEEISFKDGYVYTYNFTVRSNKVSTPSTTAFQFGVCLEGFNDARPLSDVVYTYEIHGSSTVYYYVTATVNVDSSFNQSTIPSPNFAWLYLRIATEWSDTFSLIASDLTMKKSVGEGAYYQASLDAIENLPNTEYDFTLNKMPDAEGVVEQIKGDADDITEELNLQLTNSLGVLLSLEGEEPLVYMPKMKIPILNLDLANYTKGYISPDGYFRPLDMIEDMDSSGQALAVLELARKFISIVLVFTFCTVGLEKMLKIEWWF